MDYNVGDVVYWRNNFDDDGTVIEADNCYIKIEWNKCGGTQKYANKLDKNIKVKSKKTFNSQLDAINIVSYDGCTIELAGQKYKLSLVK